MTPTDQTAPIGVYAAPEQADQLDQQFQQHSVLASAQNDYQQAAADFAAQQQASRARFQQSVLADSQQQFQSGVTSNMLVKNTLDDAQQQYMESALKTLASPATATAAPQTASPQTASADGSPAQPANAGGGSTPISGGGGDVGAAVDAATDDPRVRMAMKLGASLEGGLRGPFGVGDSGGSFGPFQINHNAGMHQDISPQDSQDPAKATSYMLGEYRAAVDKVPADMWASDPKQASRLAAFYAERPAVIYDQKRVDDAWQGLQNQPAPSTDQQGPGTFAERDLSPVITATGNDLTSHPDTAEHEADANAGVQPIAQYNQRAPDDTFQQVTRNASGNYDTAPAAQPSADQQTVYDAQDAATHGFSSPDVGVPLLASGQAAETASDTSATDASSPPPSVADQAQPPVGPDSSQAQAAPLSQPDSSGAADGMDGVKATLADLLHKAADAIGGASNAVTNATGPGTPLGKVLGSGEGAMPGQVPPLATDEQRAAMGEPPATAQQKEDDALARAAANAFPVATGAMESIGKAASTARAAEAVPAAVEDASAASRAGAVADATGTVKALPSTAAEATADDFVKAASEPAAMGGGAGGTPPVIQKLNETLADFGKAIPKDASAWDATTTTARLDNAALSASEGLGKAYQQFGLKGPERAQFSQWLEDPNALQGPVSQKVADAVSAAGETRTAVTQMAQNAGILRESIENWLPHILQIPKDELRPMGGSLKPSVLAETTSNLMQRARDEAGNQMWPTIASLRDYVAEAHPTWKVVDDPAALMAAPVRGLAQAANHAALGDYLRSSPELGAFKNEAKGLTTPVQLPSSIAKWVFRGNAPEEGSTLIGRSGVIGSSPEAPAVMEKMVPAYATPEMAQAITRYVAPDLIPTAGVSNGVLRMGKAYDGINGAIARFLVQNPIIHSKNLISEFVKEYTDPRALGGMGKDWLQTEALLRDPAARTRELEQAPLILASVTKWAKQLDDMAGQLPSVTPFLTGAKDVMGYLPGKVADFNHRWLFEGLGQRMQIMSYLAERRMGNDPVTAAKIANAKYGQFGRQDFNALATWAQSHLMVYGNWKAGSYMQYGSLIGKAGWGGYTAGLTPRQAEAFTNALRAQYVRGVATRSIIQAVMNKEFSGHWPWEPPEQGGNAPGRRTWVNMGNGQYLNPGFFTRDAGLLRPFFDTSGAFNPVLGSSRYVAGEATPIIQRTVGAATNQKYLGGPAITNKGDNLIGDYAHWIAEENNPLSSGALGFRYAAAPGASSGGSGKAGGPRSGGGGPSHP